VTEREELRLDIKRQLNSYRELEAERRQLQDELTRLEVLMDAPASPNWDGMPHGSGVSNPVERMATKHLTLLDRYRAKLVELVAAQESIENLIEGLDDSTERRLARFRYIDGMRWEDVCDKINYSWMQTHRIHGRLLDKLVDVELAKRNQ
jgi:hypothetical protein